MRYLLVAFLWLTACAGNLKPDPVPGAIDSGYPTAEILACGKRTVGLAICTIAQGDPLETLGIRVQGYYKGVVKIDSEACSIHTAQRYDNSSTVKAPISGPATKECAIDFVVSPEYPKDTSSGLVIQSLKGRVWIRVIPPGSSHFGLNTKIRQGLNAFLDIPYSDTTPTRVVFRGCGASYDKTLTPANGKLRVALHDLRNMFRVEDCIFEGAVMGRTPIRVTWQVWSYSEKFLPLSIPTTRISGGKLYVKAEAAVSVIALDRDYSITNETEFDFDPSRSHVLRLATVGGRIMIGEWNGSWTWKN